MKRLLFMIAGAFFIIPAASRAQSSERRYNRELAFPIGMINVSAGVSPVILRDFTIHTHRDAKLSITFPQVHFMAEECFWDMGNAGSVGLGVFISHGRYRYSYDGNNGRGGDVVNVRTRMTQILGGVSYHYTLATSLEIYARFMPGAVIGRFMTDRAGLKSDWSSKFIWNGVGGVRYFFSGSFGLYAEGGYTSGLINAGVTYRW